ncbi:MULTISPECIES: hypothetical protein [Halarchaeum]|uniref:ABC-type proline/glycine betaine transport system permease subunit n=2 Tax=Halarchaeum TaxID=744724 RepID=A0A830FLY3_9EURY|nr:MULTISPECIES: hypothetical protein [Halarchaeum]MBP1954813.1 ABC-type proline/glycine betaine transport system permease subunit [Halarchaeum rubridurum]MBP2249970.1 ABC-type proline/glycine betaine transport system permease subunit [Halarchaeum solikamskense]GGM59937.1 hypothetical protein GCM10009017_07630 [Halarchaeum rubridurum]GGN09367.1 hypothetical protein GCM10009021_06140 [Halarchaeum nitratireducens]
MDRKELGFGLFGVAALVEIVALALIVFRGVQSMALFYVIAGAAVVALGALGLYTLEAWRHPTSSHETTH